MWRRTIDCLGVSVAIESSVDSIDAQLAAVFRSYAESDRPSELTYRLSMSEWPALERSDGWSRRFDAEVDLVAALELDLYSEVAGRASGLILHAAAVVGVNGRALLFPGVSGAGKSTLLRSLLLQDFSYLTEECVAVSASGRCIGLARALHVEDESVELPMTFSRDPYLIRTTSGERVMRIFHPPQAMVWRAEARAAAVVCLDHGPDANDRLERLSSGETIAHLWPAVLRRRLSEALGAATVLGAIPCYSLRTTRPERALERVLSLAKELGVAAR